MKKFSFLLLLPLFCGSALYTGAQVKPVALTDSLVKNGWFLFEQRHDLAGAERSFRLALAADSTCSKAWSGLGNLNIQKEHTDSAVFFFEKTLATDSSYFNAYLNLALCHAILGNFTGAFAANRVYEQKFPDSTGWISGYAYIYKLMNRYDSALVYAELLVQRQKGPGAYTLRGEIRLESGDPAGALTDFRRELLGNPQDLSLMNRMAQVFLILDQRDSCESYLNIVLAVSPGNPMATYLMAQLQSVLGDESAALARYEALLVQQPSEIRILQDICRIITLKNTAPGEVDPDISGSTRFRNFTSFETKTLDKLATSRKSRYYHRTLRERFDTDPRSLGLDDWFMLYYGTAFSGDYNPYETNQDVNDMVMKLTEGTPDVALCTAALSMVKKDFTRFRLYFPLIDLLIKSGDFDQAHTLAYTFYCLTRAILASGDGKSAQTAYIVVSVPDEYMILGMNGYQLKQQALLSEKGHWFDTMTCTRDGGATDTIWFNIDKPYSQLGKAFGR
jgi:tetratricopeptide (TPR) repeat protein